MGIKYRALPAAFSRELIAHTMAFITVKRSELVKHFPGLTNEKLEDITFSSINENANQIKERLILNSFFETRCLDKWFDLFISVSKLNDEGVFIELVSMNQKKINLSDVPIAVLDVKKFPCMEQVADHWVLNRILYDMLAEIPYDVKNPIMIEKDFNTAVKGNYQIRLRLTQSTLEDQINN